MSAIVSLILEIFAFRWTAVLGAHKRATRLVPGLVTGLVTAILFNTDWHTSWSASFSRLPCFAWFGLWWSESWWVESIRIRKKLISQFSWQDWFLRWAPATKYWILTKLHLILIAICPACIMYFVQGHLQGTLKILSPPSPPYQPIAFKTISRVPTPRQLNHY